MCLDVGRLALAVSSERESELGHQRVEVNNKAVMVTTGVSDPESSHNGVYCEYLSLFAFHRDSLLS